ncbi:hypothetical protein Tco_0078103 [Tanacetum coccineum]
MIMAVRSFLGITRMAKLAILDVLYFLVIEEIGIKTSHKVNIGHNNAIPNSSTTTSVTNSQLQAMIDQGVTATLAARDGNRNGDDSHTSGTGGRRTERVARECTYKDFMKCKPLYFKGTEGVIELTQCHDVAYAMTWADLRKKMTDKYCPRNEMKKLEAELWNLKELALQGQVTALQGQQGPAGGPAQPELPEEAGSSSQIRSWHG